MNVMRLILGVMLVATASCAQTARLGDLKPSSTVVTSLDAISAGMGVLTTSVQTAQSTANSANSTGATHSAQIAVLNAHAAAQTNINSAVTAGMGALTSSVQTLTSVAVTNRQTGVTLNTLTPPNGFESQDAQTVSWDSASRKAIVTPVGASFRVTAGGVTYTYNNAVTSSAAGPSDTGIYAYFRSSDGAFICSTTPWTITNGEAQALYVQQDTQTATPAFMVDERHGVSITDLDHLQRHKTVGASWASGMTLSHFAADTATAAPASGSNTCVAITDAGEFWDEDIKHLTVANGSSGAALATAGVFPILYKSGSVWKKREGSTMPFAYGTGPNYWNSSNVETAVPENNYFVYWMVVYGSPNGTNIFLVSHPAVYSSTDAAKAGATIYGLSAAMGGLPFSEVLVAYRLIFHYKSNPPNAHDSTVKYTKLRAVDDYRSVPGGVILAGVAAGGSSYELTADKIAAAGGLTNGGPVAVAATNAQYVATNHVAQTNNPHIVTLQQAANAGGFTKTNQEITIRTLLSSSPQSTRYWGTGVYDGNGYSFSYAGGNPDPGEGYGAGYNWQLGIIPGSGSPHPKICYDFGTGTQSGYILFPTPSGVDQINTLALLSDVSPVQATANAANTTGATHTAQIATNTANITSNASPYQPWTATLTPPPSSGTNVLKFSDGALPFLACTGAQTVAIIDGNANGWGTNGLNRFRLALWKGAWPVTIQSNASVVWASPITLSSTKTNHLIGNVTVGPGYTNAVWYPLQAQ